MARSWYAYDGSGNKYDPGSYRELSIKPNCFSGGELCAIYAPSGGTVPDAFSIRLTDYITASLSSNTPQPNLAGAKYYLYKIVVA